MSNDNGHNPDDFLWPPNHWKLDQADSEVAPFANRIGAFFNRLVQSGVPYHIAGHLTDVHMQYSLQRGMAMAEPVEDARAVDIIGNLWSRGIRICAVSDGTLRYPTGGTSPAPEDFERIKENKHAIHRVLTKLGATA